MLIPDLVGELEGLEDGRWSLVWNWKEMGCVMCAMCCHVLPCEYVHGAVSSAEDRRGYPHQSMARGSLHCLAGPLRQQCKIMDLCKNGFV